MRSKNLPLFIFAGFSFFSLLIFPFFSGTGQTATTTERTFILKGKAVYEPYCFGCHGEKGDRRGIYAEAVESQNP
jgi:hypothetical protein